MTAWLITLAFGLVFLLLAHVISDGLGAVVFSVLYLIGLAATAVGGIGVLVKIALSYS